MYTHWQLCSWFMGTSYIYGNFALRLSICKRNSHNLATLSYTTIGSDTICWGDNILGSLLIEELIITNRDTTLSKSLSLWVQVQLCYINSSTSLLFFHVRLPLTRVYSTYNICNLIKKKKKNTYSIWMYTLIKHLYPKSKMNHF